MITATSEKEDALGDLRNRARECKGELCRLSFQSRVPGHDNAVWGQFFPSSDDGVAPLSRQFGIYGTASATAVLALSDDAHHRVAVQRFLKSLPGWDLEDPESPLDIKELHLTLKVTAVLDALPAAAAGTQWPAIQLLLDGRVPGSGWGYVAANMDPSSEPEILPTAHAVVVLLTHRAAIGPKMAHLIEAVEWMCTRVLSTSRLSRLDSAFALLALRRARDVLASDPPRHLIAALEKVTQRTLEMADRPPILVEYYEHVHYQAPSDLRIAETVPGQSHKGRYMFYPADLVAACALLEADTPERGIAYVLRVVDKVSQMVLDRGAYVSAATGRAAIADALIVVRLMDAFVRKVAVDRNQLLTSIQSASLVNTVEQMEAAERRAEALQETINSMKKRTKAANRAISEGALKDAKRRVVTLALVVLIFMSAATFTLSLVSGIAGVTWIAWVLTAVSVVLTLVPLLFPGKHLDWMKHATKWLADRIERHWRERLSLLDMPHTDGEQS